MLDMKKEDGASDAEDVEEQAGGRVCGEDERITSPDTGTTAAIRTDGTVY
jgi:hypothetical protein